jgi:hypothetical protein
MQQGRKEEEVDWMDRYRLVFEVVTAGILQTAVFCDVMHVVWSEVCRYFRETCSVHPEMKTVL